jgi:gas vesicle protein
MGFFKRVVTFGFGGIVGGGVGAAVASLLAPQSGEQLQKSVSGLMDEARTAGDAAKADTEQKLIERFRDKVNDPTAFTPKPDTGE